MLTKIPRWPRRSQIQSIPAVKAVRNGALAGEFLGAQPEPSVRRFIEQLLPSEAEALAQEAQRLEEAGKAARSRESLPCGLSQRSESPARTARTCACISADAVKRAKRSRY